MLSLSQTTTTDIERAKATDLARQYELALQGSPDDELDISFMHCSFCLSGLPLRPLIDRSQTPTDGSLPIIPGRRKELPAFFRRGGSCSLSINATNLQLPISGREICTGVPWGSRSRLLVLWATTAAQQNDTNTWLEIGSIRSWLKVIGVQYCQDSINAIKDQLIRLSFARFTMLMAHGGNQFFTNDCLFESGVFEDTDLENYADNDLTNVRMPLGLKLSDKAFQRFSGRDAIPVPTQALRTIANNSMAIDLFVYMLFKLRVIPEGETTLINWKALIGQFGNGESKSRFIKDYKASIDRAIEAMSCAAKVAVDDEGLRLHHVRPAEFRSLFVVAPSTSTTSRITRNRLVNRIMPAAIDPAKQSVLELG